MDEHRKKRLEEMPRGDQERRLEELREKLGITSPVALASGLRPPEATLEEMEEYEFLRTQLG